MRALARPAVVLGLLALAGAAVPAGALGAPGLRFEVKAAAPGAALDVLGRGLAGKRTRVTVGGKAAHVLSGNRRRVRIVVPAVKAGPTRVIARAGRRRMTGKFTVLAPFTGTIRARPDAARAASATIGAAGGSVSATGRDGTRYTLAVPAGAVGAGTAITLTPVASFGGVPLTASTPVGVIFAPAHLTLAVPATLQIAFRTRAPKHALGFSFDSSTGRSFTDLHATVSGRSVSVPVAHFSGAGTGGANPQDFADRVEDVLKKLAKKQLTVGEAEELAGLIVAWSGLFGGDFCRTQPTCGRAAKIVLTNLERLLADACPATKDPQLASFAQMDDVTRMESLRQQVDGIFGPGADSTPTDAAACVQAIIEVMFTRAIGGLVLYPKGGSRERAGALARPDAAIELDGLPDFKRSADLDRDGIVTGIEWIAFLGARASLLGIEDAVGRSQTAVTTALQSVLDEGTHVCDDNLDEAKEILTAGGRLAERLLILEQQFAKANQDCKPRVIVKPVAVGLDAGETQRFVAHANFNDPSGPIVFSWSATGGKITPTADSAVVDYTAPNAAGDYTITAETTLLVRFHEVGTATITVGCPARATEAECPRFTVLARESDGRSQARIILTAPDDFDFTNDALKNIAFTGPDLFAPFDYDDQEQATLSLNGPGTGDHGEATGGLITHHRLTETPDGLTVHLDGFGHTVASAAENDQGASNADSTGAADGFLRVWLRFNVDVTVDCTVAWDGTPPPTPTEFTSSASIDAEFGTDPDGDGHVAPSDFLLGARLRKSKGTSEEQPHMTATIGPGDYLLQISHDTFSRVDTGNNGNPASASIDSSAHADCTFS